MNTPIAVLISDVHYNLQTLALADNAMRQAIAKAHELKVALIVAGDLHDTKANMRAECINAMIETFTEAPHDTLILVGNHDRINEKAPAHTMNFLDNLKGTEIRVVSTPKRIHVGHKNFVYLIPYHHNPDELRTYLKTVPKGSTLIMHQGIQGSNSGEYIQDHSAITKDDVSDFRVISGHYHQRQDIKTGRPQKGHVGLFSYIGNPYSLNFGEAGDPEKGFRILNDDGSLDFVPTNLRKHIIIDIGIGDLDSDKTPLYRYDYSPGDLVWVKIRGNKEHLNITKQDVAIDLELLFDFRLELIPTDVQERYSQTVENLSQNDLLDSLIDASGNLSDAKKEDIKKLWKCL